MKLMQQQLEENKTSLTTIPARVVKFLEGFPQRHTGDILELNVTSPDRKIIEMSAS